MPGEEKLKESGSHAYDLNDIEEAIKKNIIPP